MQPYVVSDILGPEGEVIDHLSPVCKRQVLKEETSRTMREILDDAFGRWRGAGRLDY